MKIFPVLTAAFCSVILLDSIQAEGTTVDCHDAYSCVSANITVSSPNVTNLECFGYSSCSDSKQLVSLTDATIQCLGSYACAGSETVSHSHEGTATFGDIICCGLSSCSDISYLYNKNGSIACDGELSCAGSTVEVVDDKLYCLGDRACAGTNVALTQGKVYISGHLAAQNAKFQTSQSDASVKTIFLFEGVEAGLGAEIICGASETCRIVCSSNACSGLTLTCADADGANSCVFEMDCAHAEESATCASEMSALSWNANFSGGQVFALPSLRDVGMSSVNNSVRICEGNDACDDYLECTGGSEIEALDWLDGSVCCNAFKSCNSENQARELSVNEGEAVRCDGTMSCAKTSNYSVLLVNEDVYLTSYAAGTGTEIVFSDRKDLYCTGMESCLESTIRGVGNLYCNGGWSCKDSQLIEDVSGDIWAYGVSGLHQSVVDTVGGNVYCGTEYSCQRAQISGVAGDVLVWGLSSAGSAVLSDIGGSVVGFGTKALQSAKITNAGKVFCNGVNACQNAVMKNVGSVYGMTESSLASSTIMSEGSDNNVLTLSLNGANSGMTLYCNASDTCNIACLSDSACAGLSVYCEGTCNAECEGSLTCPTFVTPEPTLATDGSDGSDGADGTDAETPDTTDAAADSSESAVTTAGGGGAGAAVEATEVLIEVTEIISDGSGEGGHGHKKGGCNGKKHGHRGAWLLLIFFSVVAIGLIGVCCCKQKKRTVSVGDDERMRDIQRVASSSVVVAGGGARVTTGGLDTRETQDTNKTNGNGEDEENSESSSSSASKKKTEKENGEV